MSNQNLSPSSIFVYITKYNNSYIDRRYKVITYASNTARRYGNPYTTLSNEFIFDNLFTSEPIHSNIASNLTPDTVYYATVETQSAQNPYDFYGDITDSRSNNNQQQRYIRTSLPDGPVYIDSVILSNTTSNTIQYANYGISASFIILNNSNSNIIYNSKIGPVQFNIANGTSIGIHTSNNTGSSNPNIMRIDISSNTLDPNELYDVTYFLGGYTQASNDINISRCNIMLNISNIRDKYTESNYTGFYKIFNTFFSYIGQPSSYPIYTTYRQLLPSSEDKRKQTSPFYVDDINSIPSINNDIIDLSENTVVYITGIPSHNLVFNDIYIKNLYKYFVPPGNVIIADFLVKQLNTQYSNSSALTIYDLSENNIQLYDLSENILTIQPTLMGYLPNSNNYSVRLQDITIPSPNNLYSLNITSNPTLSLTVNNIYGQLRSNYILSNIYFDKLSLDVVNNTNNAYGIYGQRVFAGYYPSADGTFSNEYSSDFNNSALFINSIDDIIYDISGTINFDNTISLSSNSNYYYELPLFNGLFQTSNYSINNNLSNPYRDYSYYTISDYIYPNYTSLATGIPDGKDMFFRYICFKYSIDPVINPITNTNGLCVIQFINNNFTINSNNNKIGYCNDTNHFLIKYKIITYNSLNTPWHSLQSEIDTGNKTNLFLTRSAEIGVLYELANVYKNSDRYNTSNSSNRIFYIPPNIGVEGGTGFDIYIRLGIPKDMPYSFKYISITFGLSNTP